MLDHDAAFETIHTMNFAERADHSLIFPNSSLILLTAPNPHVSFSH